MASELRTGKVWRLDYESVFVAGTDEIIPYCITDKFRRALIQATQRMLWSKVWMAGQEEVELTDAEKSVLEAGISALCEDEGCLAYVEENLVSVTNNVNVSCGCAGETGCEPFDWGNLPPVGPVECIPIPITPQPPPPQPTPPTPPPGTTPTEWDLLRCKLANYFWTLVFDWLQAVGSVSTGFLAIGALLVALVTFAPAALVALLSWDVLIAIAAYLIEWTGLASLIQEFAEWLAGWWVEHREEIVCKIYNHTNYQSLRDGILSDILDDFAVWVDGRPGWTDGLVEATQYIVSKLLPYTPFHLIFTLVPPEDYVGDIDCTTCETAPTEPAGDEWYIDPFEMQVSTPPTFSSPEIASFDATGTLHKVGNAGYQIYFRNDTFHPTQESADPDADWLAIAAQIDGVIFDLSYSANPAWPAGQGLTYGARNHKTVIETYGNGKYCLYIASAYEEPPDVSADFYFAVENVRNIGSLFSLFCVEYNPPDRTVSVEVSNFAGILEGVEV